jgi:hypothetical protein
MSKHNPVAVLPMCESCIDAKSEVGLGDAENCSVRLLVFLCGVIVTPVLLLLYMPSQ